LYLTQGLIKEIFNAFDTAFAARCADSDSYFDRAFQPLSIGHIARGLPQIHTWVIFPLADPDKDLQNGGVPRELHPVMNTRWTWKSSRIEPNSVA
jgi:hypothetical protein